MDLHRHMCGRAIAIPWDWVWWRTTYWVCYRGSSGQRNTGPGSTCSPTEQFGGLLHPPCTLSFIPMSASWCPLFRWTFPDYPQHGSRPSPSSVSYQLRSHSTWYEPLLENVSHCKRLLPCFYIQRHVSSCSMDGSSLCPRAVSGYCTDSEEKQAYLLQVWYHREVPSSVREIAKDLFEQTLKTNKGTTSKIINSKRPYKRQLMFHVKYQSASVEYRKVQHVNNIWSFYWD